MDTCTRRAVVRFLAFALATNGCVDGSNAAGGPSLSFSRRIGHGATRALAFDAPGNLIIMGALDGQFDPTVTGPDESSDGGLYHADGFLVQVDPSGRTRWVKRWEGSSFDAMALDSLGQIVLATTPAASSGVTGTGPPPDVVAPTTTLTAVDSSGATLWSRSTLFGKARALGFDSGGNLLMLTADGVLAKFDPTGATSWTLNGISPYSTAAVNATGEVAVLGATSTDGNTSVLEVFSSAGQRLWSRTLTASGGFEPTAIALDPAGEVAIAGTLDYTLDLGGPTLLATPTASYGSPVFVARYHANGDYVWAEEYGGQTVDPPGGRPRVSAGALAFAAEGRLFIAGIYAGEITFGAASFTTSGDGATHLFLAELDNAGNCTSGAQYGDPRSGQTAGNSASSLAAGPSGQVAIGGSFAESIGFGGGTIKFATDPKAVPPGDFNDPLSEGYDAFVAAFEP